LVLAVGTYETECRGRKREREKERERMEGKIVYKV